MVSRIIEIAEDKRYLSVFRGFLLIKSSEEIGKEIARIPLDDVAAIIANSYGITYSNNLLVKCAEEGIPFIVCGQNHSAVGILWGVDGHHEQARRFDAQIHASLPTKKRLWKTVVQAKLYQQGQVLERLGKGSISLVRLRTQVKPGDPQNIEAQAARTYWQQLFGNDFRRNRRLQGINSLLNYGYTVLRAMTGRAVLAAGLHPTLGIHHLNQGNPMRLVDDLMEPFRPVIDFVVWKLSSAGMGEVNAETKRELVLSLYKRIQKAESSQSIDELIMLLATSLALVYVKERKELNLPPDLTAVE